MPNRDEGRAVVVTIGIGELAVSAEPDDVLITYSLGSCIGLTMYDPVARVGGMIHCMLPESTLNPDKARERPAMFIDTGVAELLRLMRSSGANPRRLNVKVAGAATPLGDTGVFRIGQRNVEALRATLPRLGLRVQGHLVGGTAARTMVLHIGTGRAVIRNLGQEREL